LKGLKGGADAAKGRRKKKGKGSEERHIPQKKCRPKKSTLGENVG